MGVVMHYEDVGNRRNFTAISLAPLDLLLWFQDKRSISGVMPRPIAYSYARFSTPEQERGDSERRQIEAARQYAEQHGFVLDESIVVDRGVSAFAGKNVSEGASKSCAKAQVNSPTQPRFGGIHQASRAQENR